MKRKKQRKSRGATKADIAAFRRAMFAADALASKAGKRAVYKARRRISH